jgi:hypothetical protein
VPNWWPPIHPQVVEHYRAAHAVRQIHHGDSGSSNTEEFVVAEHRAP